MKPFCTRLLFLGRFLMVASISSLFISLFRFPSSSWFSPGWLYICRNVSISSRLLNLVAYSLSYYSGMILHISVIFVVTSLSFLILFIWVVFFFLSESSQGFANYINYFKESPLSFIIFKYIFLLYFTQFCSNFIICFLSLTLGCFCSSFL